MRVQLNRLLGLPDRNYTPAFRIRFAQVERACELLFRAKRETDPTAARLLKYEASRVIYPPQNCDAVKDGLFLIFKAGFEAMKTEAAE